MQKKQKSKVLVQITTFDKVTKVVMPRKDYDRLKKLKGIELISIVADNE